MKNINVEEIMKEIRADIKARNLSETDLKFQDVKMAENDFQMTLLQDELKMANLYSRINLHGDVGGIGIKRFIKRFIRKCVRFYVQPMLEQQNEFNAHCVRTLNTMNMYILENEKKIREMEEKISCLEKE